MARKEGMESMHILVSEAGKEKIKAAAKRRGSRSYADYIRDLIKRDMLIHHEEPPEDVEWGGNRQPKSG